MQHNIHSWRILLLLGTLLGPVACKQDIPTTRYTSGPALSRPIFTTQAPVDEKNIVIPGNALVMRGGIPGVFVLSDQDLARFRMVKPGKQRDAYTSIVSGLHHNEQLVTGDLSAVRDGSPIIVK
ncbi:MAG: hypothetical protein GXP09_06850 [Gammaproteobacteria bacterium]|nr:hypothetical protein [Gammaproteobacteria bacterium]